MKRYFASAAVAMAAFLGAMPAQAQSAATASAWVGPVGYTLTDLAPGDGALASFAFTTHEVGGQMIVTSLDGLLFNREWLLADGTATAHGLGGVAQGQVDGTSIRTSASAGAGVTSSAIALFVDGFVLSPNTLLTLTWTAHVDQTDTSTNEGWGSLRLVTQLDHDWRGSTLFISDVMNTDDDDGDKTFTASLQTGTDASGGYVSFYADSESQLVLPPPPVPEAPHWMMLAAGLAFTGYRLRCAGGGASDRAAVPEPKR